MSTPFRPLCVVFCTLAAASAQTVPPSVGSGVSIAFQTRFQIAFLRGAFSTLVLQPPLADVHKFGTSGLIQEFYDTAKTSGVKAALILPDQTKIGFDNDVLQVYPELYTYYTAVGVNTAGYPVEDTQFCPSFYPRCTFQRFTNNYALFSIPVGNANGTQFSLSGNFFLKWTALNGIIGLLGIPADVQKSLTSSFKTTSDYQTLTGGTLFNVTSGTNKGLAFSVLGATDTLYESLNGVVGPLGLPLGDELSLAGGIQRQLFEGGRIQYPTGGTPVLLYPIAEVQLSLTRPITLQSGQTVTVTEHGYDTGGAEALGRTVTWFTTNGQVVSIQASGNTAVLTGRGSGYALVTATSEGKVSSSLLINVSAPCCGVGEGAPSVSIGQTFQDAVARNRLILQIPGPNPVKRISTGYTQDLLSTDGLTHYLLAKGDQSGSAYLVSGPLLAAYLQAGGPTGSLGFPLADVTAGGTQVFAGGALAGSPLRTVTGAILTKWAALNYETGSAGTPTAAATSFSTQSGYSGQAQTFTAGTIFGISSGNRAGQGFFLTGPILARYGALNGPAGPLGLPTGDAFATGMLQRQNFDNGYIDFATGAATAQEHLVPRTPAVSANPASALAGSRLHLSVTGFPDGATLRISVAGQPDFTVKTQNGSYEWDLFIDSSAKTASVAVHAVDVATNKTADGSYSVKTISDANPKITKTAGDNQTGSPGSLLPVRLAVAVKDNSGSPLAGVLVAFSPSPGAQVSPVTVLTDLNGVAATNLRLPPVAGLAAVSASSLGRLAIFDARSSGSGTNPAFPQFTQDLGIGPVGNGTDSIADKGGFLTSVAAIVRFYQNQGLLATPNGLADPNTLNQFLKVYCAPLDPLAIPPAGESQKLCDGFVSNLGSTEQVVNLWRVGAFVGGGLVPSIEDPNLSVVRDLVGAGSPVLLSLALIEDGVPAGGSAVVATAIAADGALMISDPNPALARTALNDYLLGFNAAGHTWKASVLSALRLLPGQPSATGFVFASVAQSAAASPVLTAQSASGSCGAPFFVQNSASLATGPASGARISEFLYCDGTQVLYQAAFGASQAFSATVTDLAPGGSSQDLSAVAGMVYQITRAPRFAVTAPSVNFVSASVVNAASFQPSVAPGELVSIFGSGLSGPGAPTVVTINGVNAPVLAASAFQVNAQIPLEIQPGAFTLSVRSSFGNLDQPLTVVASSPAIFVLGANDDGTPLGAIVNQAGAINRQTVPARRGEVIVIYGTGFGAVVSAAGLSKTAIPVNAILDEATLPVAYAGLTPGFIGLYQVNVSIPLGTPPGLALPLSLRQGTEESNSVRIAVQ